MPSPLGQVLHYTKSPVLPLTSTQTTAVWTRGRHMTKEKIYNVAWHKKSWTNQIRAFWSCPSQAKMMHRENPRGRVWATSGQNLRESRTKWTDATKKVANCGKGLDHTHKCILWSEQYIKFLKMTPSLWSLKYHSPQKGIRTPWRNSCFQIRGWTYKRWA